MCVCRLRDVCVLLNSTFCQLLKAFSRDFLVLRLCNLITRLQPKRAAMKRALDLGEADPTGPARATVNPYTGRPYTQKYYDILEKREGEWVCLGVVDWVCARDIHKLLCPCPFVPAT